MAENKYVGWGKVTLSPKVKKEDVESGNWKPQSVINHTPEFVAFINSLEENGFNDKIEYYPFEVYKAQAFKWLEENVDPYQTDYPEETMLNELRRIDVNTLYFAEKYAFFKEGSDEKGLVKYHSKEHNALIYYLIDCGYCLLVGKPRQIFATTTIGIFVIKRLLTRYNYYMKFVTVSDDKGTEILTDKFKFPFQHLPDWMKCVVNSDNINAFHLGEKRGKGDYGYPNSRCEKVAPSPTAINGGAPQMTLIDEIGEVPDLIPILFETRPTLFIDKHQDGNLQLVRSLIAWGTGVSSNNGKRAFQQFWTSTKKLWDEGEYKAAIFVPVFLSWHCRATPEVYESEKKAYMTGASDSVKNMANDTDRAAMFNMHYPSKPHDMFGMSSNTLVSKSVIEDGFKQIKKLSEDQQPIYGYFEPIYDTSKPIEGFTPFKITGAIFVPTSKEDYKANVCMIKRPDLKWRNRYYQGTDPVLHDTGRSFMCSVIWDKSIPIKDKDNNETYTKAPICFVYHRTPYDTKESYLQCMLMGLYYDTDHEVGAKEGVPELIENNIGVAYRDFKEFYGFYKSIVYNTQLFDPDLQGGGAKWGINTSGHGMNRRKSKVVSRLKELIADYGQNIFYKTFWEELQTYVSDVKTDVVWKPVDPKIYRDDCLDGTTFGYICMRSHDHKPAYRIDSEVKLKNTKYELRRDSNFNNVLVPVVKVMQNGQRYDNNI